MHDIVSHVGEEPRLKCRITTLLNRRGYHPLCGQRYTVEISHTSKVWKGFRQWIIYISCHDTQKIHHHGAWLVRPLLPSPHTLPLALHHLADWIIVFCHRHCNAYLWDYPDVGDTIIHMPATLNTDGRVIASARWRSPCFVIRFIVISCGLFLVWCFQIHFPIRCHWGLI